MTDAQLPATRTASKLESHLAPADQLGQWIAKSKMFRCTTVEQGKLIALECLAKGMTPLEFVQTYDVIETRYGPGITYKASAMLAKFVAAGHDYDITKWDETGCTMEFTLRRGDKEKVRSYTFGKADAEKAQLLAKDNYKHHTKDMYFSRCTAKGLRMWCPELFAGHYLADEIIGEERVLIEPPPAAPERKMFEPDPVEAAEVQPAAAEPATEDSETIDEPEGVPEAEADAEDAAAIQADMVPAKVVDALALAGCVWDDAVAYMETLAMLPPGTAADKAWQSLTSDHRLRLLAGLDGFVGLVRAHGAESANEEGGEE